MSSIFSNSLLTIAAADGENHREGIFRKRPRCVRPFELPYEDDAPYRERTHFDGEEIYYCFPKSKFLGSGNRAKGTLDSRAWILQEQLLSPRILYFGHEELFWDCVTLSAYGSSPISPSLLGDKDPDEMWALKLLRKTLAQSSSVEVLDKRISDVWCQIIKNYSARALTKPTDKLIALEGILRPLGAILDVEPVAGMWPEDIWKQLLWWAAKPSSNAIFSQEDALFAPSWSWLSAQRPVYYHNSMSSDKQVEGHALHKFTDLENYARMLSSTSEVIIGATTILRELVVEGPSFAYRLTQDDLKKTVYKRWNAAQLKLNIGNWLLDHRIQLPLDIQCVIVAEDAVAKILICLCLVPDEHAVGQWKRRIGLYQWNGLAFQVSRYIGKDPKKMMFAIV